VSSQRRNRRHTQGKKQKEQASHRRFIRSHEPD
jgi:hypothetical protein